MNKPTSKRINDQKKVTRGLKGLIIALFAAIGILKISIGGVVNVPIALLFGDIFIGFFTLLIMFAFYLMLFPLPENTGTQCVCLFSAFRTLNHQRSTLREYLA